MCVGYRGIFRLPPVGKMGGRPMDRQYMLDVEKRARAMQRACGRSRKKKEQKGAGKQMELPL